MDNNRVLNHLPKPRDAVFFNSIGRGAFPSALKAHGDVRWSVGKSKCRYK